MSKTILIYTLLAIIAAILLAAFHYLYKNKKNNKLNYLLTFLRFISVLGLLLLLINPKFKKNTITTIKPNLVVLVDNTQSIKNTKKINDINTFIKSIQTDKAINNKFKLIQYAFSDDLEINDSVSFNKQKTGIYKSLKSANLLFNNTISPIVLLTDGNQTQGVNYSNYKSKQPIYPIIVGDTTTYQDIRIAQLNVNKYAYLNHKFPVEAFVFFEGNQNNIDVNFVVKDGNQTVFSKKINLGIEDNSKQLNFYLPSNKVGIHNYKASVSYLKNEKNTINNNSNFTVEIINEQSKILLISNMLHPDIGMLKRAVESNIQRKLVVKKPSDNIVLNNYQMVILYQPDQSFKGVFEKVKDFKKNFLIFTGTKTNWNFLNSSQPYFKKSIVNSTEDYIANFNTSFTTYLTDDLGFNNFSPVQDYFGDVTFSVPYESLLFQQISNFSSENPLMATFEENNNRGAVFFGENMWRWRMASFVEEKSFQPFDEFINKTIQYLASTKRTDFLEIKYKKQYYANDNVKVIAYYYDANYKFNENIKLWINITNKATKKQIKYPFALQSNSYEVNVSNLKSGNYNFSVFDENKKNIKKGSFSILPYDIEQQYVGANKKELKKLAINTKGEPFYLNQFDELKNQLIEDKNYVAIQKSKEKITALIDWKWLLAIITLSLSIEWFIRKYKGLL